MILLFIGGMIYLAALCAGSLFMSDYRIDDIHPVVLSRFLIGISLVILTPAICLAFGLGEPSILSSLFFIFFMLILLAAGILLLATSLQAMFRVFFFFLANNVIGLLLVLAGILVFGTTIIITGSLQ